MLIFDSLNYYIKLRPNVQYLTFSIAIIGIIGNISTVILFSKSKTLRKHSFSYFSQAKAISDTIFLIYCIKNWIYSIYNVNLDLVHPIFCKTSTYFSYASITTSMCLVAILSLDSLLTICCIYDRFRTCFSSQKWPRILLILAAFIYGLAFEMILPINLVYQVFTFMDGDSLTTCLISADNLRTSIWIFVGNIIFLILFVNLLSSLKLICSLWSGRNRVTRENSKDLREAKVFRDERKLAVASLGFSFMSILFKLPVAVISIYLNLTELDLDLSALLMSINGILLAIECANSFYVNLFLNSIFKKELLNIFFT